jgi:hypothetical protein
MEKYDVKKAYKQLFSPPRNTFAMVEVPEFQFLAVDGKGDPNTADSYADAVAALYGTAYTLKFTSKLELRKDFVVAPMEGLWRADDPAAFRKRHKDEWEWTMLVNQPEWITEDMVEAAVAKAAAKHPSPAFEGLGLVARTEGLSVQTLHIGSYESETPVLERLHDHYLPYNKLTFNGDHHEIYLSDARRTAPAKLKTILRQPVKPVE